MWQSYLLNQGSPSNHSNVFPKIWILTQIPQQDHKRITDNCRNNNLSKLAAFSQPWASVGCSPTPTPTPFFSASTPQRLGTGLHTLLKCRMRKPNSQLVFFVSLRIALQISVCYQKTTFDRPYSKMAQILEHFVYNEISSTTTTTTNNNNNNNNFILYSDDSNVQNRFTSYNKISNKKNYIYIYDKKRFSINTIRNTFQ